MKKIVIVLLSLLTLVMFSSCNNSTQPNQTDEQTASESSSSNENYDKLSEKEKLAFDAISNYKNDLLKNPESLQLHEIKFFDDDFWSKLDVAEDIQGTYIMFDNSAQNSMGGMTRDIVVYCDGKFVLSSVKDYEGKEDTVDLKTNILFLSWQYKDAETIDVNSIIGAIDK